MSNDFPLIDEIGVAWVILHVGINKRIYMLGKCINFKSIKFLLTIICRGKSGRK